MKKLNVFFDALLVGYLTENEKQGLCFNYTPEWLNNYSASPLSPNLLLSKQSFEGEPVESFFENLLPEGDVLDFISQAAHISAGNVFGLLERFGGDMAGAFSVLPENVLPSDTPHYLPVTKAEISQWFQHSWGIPLNIKGEQARMSLSGAQEKMTVFIDSKGCFFIPLGSAPSSHIIKPSINHRLDLPDTAINEVLIMLLAREVKLDVAEVFYDADLSAAIITRYDRKMEQGKLKRLHQNDLCQVLGVPSTKKYEAEGGLSLTSCFEAVLKHSSQPAKDKKRLIEWVIFNLLVGNMDGHAKNLSLITTNNNKKQLTPFYDLVCTAVYPGLSRKLAFKIGGENRPDWIMHRHWERFATDTHTKPAFVISLLADIVLRIEKALPYIVEKLMAASSLSNEKRMITQIDRSIHATLSKIKSRII
ncbi:MAG: type II toxin-antitoxin system HipA family toxin [Methylococcales bacterium]